MKNIDEHYKDWCGTSHISNSNTPVHDSAEAQDFAQYYYNRMMELYKMILPVDEIEEIYIRLISSSKELDDMLKMNDKTEYGEKVLRRMKFINSEKIALLRKILKK
jgi:hypothetical protein